LGVLAITVRPQPVTAPATMATLNSSLKPGTSEVQGTEFTALGISVVV
jgi:hypothetical protein